MRLRPKAASTLATHLCDTFPEHVRRLVCIVDHANIHTNMHGMSEIDEWNGATNTGPGWLLIRLRPKAASRLATHLTCTLPEHVSRLICIVDHVNIHTSDRGWSYMGISEIDE